MDSETTVAEVLARLERRIAETGLASLAASAGGEWAAFRRFEMAAFMNRIRTLRPYRPEPLTVEPFTLEPLAEYT